MTPDYYRKLAGAWLRLAELERAKSYETHHFRMHAAQCMLLADDAEKPRNSEPEQPDPLKKV
jgi:hypothetical protein